MNWNFFFTDKGFKRDDLRIRSVPFTVRRPCFLEAKRIHHILSTVEVAPYDSTTDLDETQEENPEEEIEPHDNNFISENKNQENLAVQVDTEDKIADAIIRNDLDALIDLFDSDYPMPVLTDVSLIKTPVYIAVEHNVPRILEYLLDLDTGDLDSSIPGWLYRTALHRAAFDGRQELVKMLLDAGANPVPKDIHGKTPYLLGNPQIRDFFRRYAGENPQKYDWAKLGITMLTPEMEEEKKQKQAEKKRRKKQQAKKRQQEKKLQAQEEMENQKLEQQEAELQKIVTSSASERAAKIANMSEREKRALAAETRFATTLGKTQPCDFCGVPLTMVPFERLNYKYCKLECVRKHMDELEKQQQQKKEKK